MHTYNIKVKYYILFPVVTSVVTVKDTGFFLTLMGYIVFFLNSFGDSGYPKVTRVVPPDLDVVIYGVLLTS